jgi:PAS domain S-box-containing protein
VRVVLQRLANAPVSHDPRGGLAVNVQALRSTLERAGDGAFVIGAGGHIVLWNRAAERILGYTARTVLGRPCCDVFVGMDGSGNRLCYRGCHVMNLVSLGEPVQSFDMRTRTKSGHAVWLNISILTVAGGTEGALTIHLFRDVTATRELMSLVHERLAGPPAGNAPGSGGPSLSRRELEVLRLMADGASTPIAAERLHVSRATIRNHVQSILAKLGVHSRLEAVAFATKQRLL